MAAARRRRFRSLRESPAEADEPIPTGPCPHCGRPAGGETIEGDYALAARKGMRSALGFAAGDRFAFAHCRSGVIATTENRDILCVCDRANWERALREYDRIGSAKAWERLRMPA